MDMNHKIYDIVALGEILIDFTSEGVNEEGQLVFAQNPGGAPANVAVAAARLGARTAFLGKTGADMHGRFLRETLRGQNVETAGLILDPDWFTTLAFVKVDESGERSFSFARKPGADTMFRREELNQELLDRCRILHVGSLSLTNEPARGATLGAIEYVKNQDGIISYDPNYRASLWESEEAAIREMRSVLPYADLLKISDEEAALLTGEMDVEKAADAMIRQDISVVAVTMGGDGAYIRNREGGQLVPGFSCKTVDTTGAGDSFWGGFLYKLCQSNKIDRPQDFTLEELSACARFGNAVASLCVERKGAIPAMPDLEQVMGRLEGSEAKR